MNLDTLEKVSSILFDELRSRGLQEIEVEDVFYRVVPWLERHSIGGERVELEVGSISMTTQIFKESHWGSRNHWPIIFPPWPAFSTR